jgi:hypothetical protein
MHKNSIEHFLPCNGKNPDVTTKVLTTWNSKAKENVAEDVEIPVEFPEKAVSKYKKWNSEYVPSTPIKEQEATHLMKIFPLDIRYLLGCGLQWDAQDPSASSGPAQSLLQSARVAAPAPGPSDDAATADRSRSASPPAD